jgi:hypothetical protein
VSILLFHGVIIDTYYFCSTKLAMEAQHGLIAQVLKDYIFGQNQQLQESLSVLDSAIASET